MPYQSIDQIQNLLSNTIFAHTGSSKKAAGRALGTIVEIISFYLLKAWGHEYKIALERSLPEYANQEITHNVEFSFHKNQHMQTIPLPLSPSISSTRIFNSANIPTGFQKPGSPRNLLKGGVIKNACTFAYSDTSFCNAYFSDDKQAIHIYELFNTPYVMFECKRVGVEEGMKKGPQTIEKAKQGAYVARTVSGIQRVRLKDGRIGGAIERNGSIVFYDDYYTLIEEAISSHDIDILSNFILTVGIVSNHGNWFTTENQNKEMKVLAQSYDWLLFLTDEGLASFIQDIIGNSEKYGAVKDAFENSYKPDKSGNRFTKVFMDYDADTVLTDYFNENIRTIESWFNVIAPKDRSIEGLNLMLNELSRAVM